MTSTTTGHQSTAVRADAAGGVRTTPTARSEARNPVRLTRRGRVVLVLGLLAALLLVGFMLGQVSSSSAAGQPVTNTVVVHSGDTLWSIAARVAPQRDPRGVVAQLMVLNHLHGAVLEVGERLSVPA
jgi:LysM repeat protein